MQNVKTSKKLAKKKVIRPNGSNYELAVADSRKWYDEQEEYIHRKYGMEEED